MTSVKTQEILQQYMQKEMSKTVTNTNTEKLNARRTVNKVMYAQGNTLVEKAKNAGVDYNEFMKAQRLTKY